MNPVQISSGKAQILYDADLPVQADSRFFDPHYWQAQGALNGTAMGRGTTFFVRDGDNEWVVRHYRRGGLVARLLRDSYLWQGLAATRAWREWHLLAELFAAGLPVPQPVAAQVVRRGLWYRADIVTRRLAAAPLAERLRQGRVEAGTWAAVGAAICRVHDAGVWHADLNAHNILLDARETPFIIDLDRGERRPRDARAEGWRQGNLQRLHRSLRKLARLHGAFHFDERDWDALMAGYSGGREPKQ